MKALALAQNCRISSGVMVACLNSNRARNKPHLHFFTNEYNENMNSRRGSAQREDSIDIQTLDHADSMQGKGLSSARVKTHNY